MTPGAVVLRTEVFELIQYAPQHRRRARAPAAGRAADDQQVLRHRPRAGPQHGRVPGRRGAAGVRDLVAQPGRAPPRLGPRHLRGGDPRGARAPRGDHRRRPRALLGLCAGGVVLVQPSLGTSPRPASTTGRRHHARVCVLDNERAGHGERVRRPAGGRGRWPTSARKGYLDGRALAGVFAWLRPNDLIWNYWVNNYLLGRTPPAFDILYWNADTTNMPAALHRDFMSSRSTTRCCARRADRARHAGRPAEVTADAYIVAGDRPTTSRRGRTATARRSCSAARRASCCPRAGTSPRSSTRPATRRRATSRHHNPPRRTPGSQRRRQQAGHLVGGLGRTGWPSAPGGRVDAPERSAAPRTRRSGPRPAPTCSSERRKAPSRRAQADLDPRARARCWRTALARPSRRGLSRPARLRRPRAARAGAAADAHRRAAADLRAAGGAGVRRLAKGAPGAGMDEERRTARSLLRARTRRHGAGHRLRERARSPATSPPPWARTGSPSGSTYCPRCYARAVRETPSGPTWPTCAAMPSACRSARRRSTPCGCFAALHLFADPVGRDRQDGPRALARGGRLAVLTSRRGRAAPRRLVEAGLGAALGVHMFEPGALTAALGERGFVDARLQPRGLVQYVSARRA